MLAICNREGNNATGGPIISTKMAEYSEPRHAASHDGARYFKGSIQEAIGICRSKKAFLLVFLEGTFINSVRPTCLPFPFPFSANMSKLADPQLCGLFFRENRRIIDY